jgi:4-methyl-5(b-hydroxyethyl)-thiazole monophosphate biosynthesis
MTDTIHVLVPIADGSEEIEAVTIIDTLRRAEMAVTVASVTDRREVVCSRSVGLIADELLTDRPDAVYDAIVLPGGMPGARHLRDCEPLIARLRDQVRSGRLLAAICAAPQVVLQHHGLIGGRRATCHPSFYELMDPESRRPDRVVLDGQLVTSRGPGTALEFALALVGVLRGPRVRHLVAEPMLPPGPPRDR